jgi:tetratricopeptide (TPR) repeat protein
MNDATTIDPGDAVPVRGGMRHAPAAPAGFDLLEEVGRGGMGVVYRARDLALDREVAVKVLQDRFAPGSATAVRFVEEARITAQLQHPGIPAVYQVGALPGGRPFLAMKLIKGQTLADRMKDGPPLDPLAVIEAVSQAVGYAHAHGVIHRDLKPANVMVGRFGEVQVMDWGLAKVLASRERQRPEDDPAVPTATMTEVRSRRESDGTHTLDGSVLGTPAFMPPEQAAGELDRVGAPSDVFGLGAILCALLTGKPPFDGPDAEGARLNAVRGRTEGAFARLSASGADPDVIALCKRCLAFEPADRPADAGAVAAAVAALRRAADERARQAERDRLTAATVKFLEDRVFAAARPQGQDGGLGKDVTLRDALAASLPALTTDFADQPLVEARLRMTLGTSFLCLGEADTAAAQYQAARRLYTDHRGPDHPDTLAGTDKLAASYADLGRHAEALQLRTEALAARRTRLGPDHPDTVAGMSELARSYNALARHAEALALREQVVALRQARPGPDHPDTLASLSDLATSYYFLSRHAEALRLREEALARRTARLGRHHPDTLQSLFDVAISHLALDRNAEALARFEQARALREAALGPTHPDTLWALWGVAAAYAALGRYDEALPRFEQTFALRTARLGPDHPDTLWTVWGLAESLVALGRGAEAVPLIDVCVTRAAGQVAYPRLIPGVLYVRLRYFERTADAPGCRQTAALWEGVNRFDAGSLYTAARMRAIAARAGQRANQPAGAASDADRALAWLTRAVAAGFRDRARLEADSDLDALRGREDFQSLIAALPRTHEVASPLQPVRCSGLPIQEPT